MIYFLNCKNSIILKNMVFKIFLFIGINYILKSLKFESSAEILLTNHTYLTVQNTAEEIEKFLGMLCIIFNLAIKTIDFI